MSYVAQFPSTVAPHHGKVGASRGRGPSAIIVLRESTGRASGSEDHRGGSLLAKGGACSSTGFALIGLSVLAAAAYLYQKRTLKVRRAR